MAAAKRGRASRCCSTARAATSSSPATRPRSGSRCARCPAARRCASSRATRAAPPRVAQSLAIDLLPDPAPPALPAPLGDGVRRARRSSRRRVRRSARRSGLERRLAPRAGSCSPRPSTPACPSLLRYADRSSMAQSREVRLPFLDRRIAEFALSLPGRRSSTAAASRSGSSATPRCGLVPGRDPRARGQGRLRAAAAARGWRSRRCASTSPRSCSTRLARRGLYDSTRDRGRRARRRLARPGRDLARLQRRGLAALARRDDLLDELRERARRPPGTP